LAGMGSYHLYVWLKKFKPEDTKALVLPIAILLAIAVMSFTPHVIALTIWALCFGAIFLKGNDLLSRCFSLLRGIMLRSSFQWLGNISYPLYLIHWPVLLITLRLLLYEYPAISSTEAVLVLFFVAVPLILLAALALHVWIEIPGRTLGRRTLKKLPSQISGKQPGGDYANFDTVKNTTP